MRSEQVDAGVVRTLAQVAGIDVPEEDVQPLVSALQNHLKGMEALDDLDLAESDPVVTFDPRWR
jgi:Asp-tRNA(Asn)/Glu-tRNA(Gln) amidotransferase C subunit